MKHFYIGCRVKVINIQKFPGMNHEAWLNQKRKYVGQEGTVNELDCLNLLRKPGNIGVTLDKDGNPDYCFAPDELEIISKPPEPEVTFSEELELVS